MDGDQYTNAQFHPNEDQVLAVSRSNTGLWDIKTGKQVRRFVSLDGERVLAAAISDDGARVVTVSWSDGATIRLWSVHTGQLLDKQGSDIAASTGYINGLNDEGIVTGLEWAQWSADFSPDGTRVITAAGDGAARIWAIGPYGADLLDHAQSELSADLRAKLQADRMVFWELER